MKNKLFYILSFTTLFCFGQHNLSISFIDLIENWEQKYQLTFSYADEEIQDIFLSNDFIDLPIEDFSELQISYEFPFSFIYISDEIIAIVPKDNFRKIKFKTLDFETNKPVSASISFTNFLYKNHDDGWFHCIVSNSLNSFKIEADSYLDYNFSIEKEKKYLKNIYLIPEQIQLDEVLVNNYLTKGIDMNRRGELVLKNNDFGVLPGQIEADVLQSIQLLPGIISAEESLSYINVRGGTHDQNLFLFDGIKKYQTAHFFGMISAFNPFMVHSTTLTKNGTSAAFGESVSSVIEIKTDEKINDTLHVQFGANLISTDVFIDAPVSEKMSFQLATRRSITDVYKSLTYRSLYNKVFQNSSVISTDFIANDTDEFSFLDTSFRLNFAPSENDFIRLSFSFSSNDFSIQQSTVEFPLSFERESSLSQDDLGVGMYYRREHSEKWNSSLQYYYSSYNLSEFNLNLNNNQSLLQKNSLEEYGVKFLSTYRFNSNWQFLVGGQINETSVTNLEEVNNPLFFRSVQEAMLSLAGFSSLTYKNLATSTFIDIGGRINHYSKFNKLYVEPRINISQGFLDNFTIQFKAEQKSQVTSQIVDLQTDFLGVESRRWVLSNNENIPVITSEQVSVGLQYKKRNFLASVDYFIKNVDGITSQSQSFLNQFQFLQTIGNYRVSGFDILLNQHFSDIDVWLNYSYADNTYRFEDFVPSQFRHNLDIRHVVSFGANYSYKDWKFSSGINWHSGVPTTPLESDLSIFGGEEVSFGNPNQQNLPNYFRWDASVNYRFSINDRINAISGVSFWNILNRENIYNRFYSIEEDGSLVEVDQMALKFTPNIMFRIIW